MAILPLDFHACAGSLVHLDRFWIICEGHDFSIA
jgi:hypothetical protein